MLKYLSNTSYNKNILDYFLFALRLLVGIGMLTHGLEKLQLLMNGKEATFFDFLGMGKRFSLQLAVFSEVVCSTFIILGLFTRVAVVPLIITMLVAVLIVLEKAPFANKELGLLYLFSYVLILITGAGKLSIDYLIQGNQPAATLNQ